MAIHGAGQRPDVVLFMVDQLSAKWLEEPYRSCISSPNIDRLQADGVTFTRAFSSNPICMAARPTIATGLTARSHGVLTNGYRLDSRIPTFMQLLQRENWRTGAFGKVHFYPHFMGVHPDYRPFGFDECFVTEDPRAGEWLDWLSREHPQHFEAALATIWPTEISELKSYGDDGINLSKRIKEVRASFNLSTKEFPQNDPGAYTLPFPAEVSQTEWITGHAVDFIRSVDRNQPIFAHVSYVQPHSPFCPPAEYVRRVDRNAMFEPVPIEWLEDPAVPDWFDDSEGARRSIPSDWQRRRQHYFADIMHLDHQLGEVISTLKDSGRLETTYVIFISDHGELLFDHGFTGKAERHYDACVRVPLIISGPGVRAGTTSDLTIQHEDIFPTVLDMTGIAAPEPQVLGPYLKESPEYLPGKSLLGQCRGEKPESWREVAYIESYNNIGTALPIHWARTVRTNRWRYTLYPDGAGEQLFDMVNDLDEQKNLVRDKSYADIRQTMRDLLLEKVILQDYPLPVTDLFAIGVH